VAALTDDQGHSNAYHAHFELVRGARVLHLVHQKFSGQAYHLVRRQERRGRADPGLSGGTVREHRALFGAVKKQIARREVTIAIKAARQRCANLRGMHLSRLWLLAVVVVAVSCSGTDSRCDAGTDGGCEGGSVGGGTGGGGGSGGGGGGSSAAALTGIFDLTWSQGAMQWTLEGRGLSLTVHDDGIDETNYDATGTVTIAPATYTDGAQTCTLAEPAAKALDEQYFFKVLKASGGPAQRWGYAAQWDYTCSSGGGSQTVPVIVNFRTAQGTACMTPVDVAAPSPPVMSGSFSMSCLPPYAGVASWSFTP